MSFQISKIITEEVSEIDKGNYMNTSHKEIDLKIINNLKGFICKDLYIKEEDTNYEYYIDKNDDNSTKVVTLDFLGLKPSE